MQSTAKEKRFHDSETNLSFELVTSGKEGYLLQSPQYPGTLLVPQFVSDAMNRVPSCGTIIDAQGNNWEWNNGDDYASFTVKNQLCSLKVKVPVSIWHKMLRAMK